jgi:hypothetical protein
VPNVTVDVNEAERDAIEQVLQRHGSVFDNYERHLLQQLLTKIDNAGPPRGAGSAGSPSQSGRRVCEIARIMECAEGTARAHLARAYAALLKASEGANDVEGV